MTESTDSIDQITKSLATVDNAEMPENAEKYTALIRKMKRVGTKAGLVDDPATAMNVRHEEDRLLGELAKEGLLKNPGAIERLAGFLTFAAPQPQIAGNLGLIPKDIAAEARDLLDNAPKKRLIELTAKAIAKDRGDKLPLTFLDRINGGNAHAQSVYREYLNQVLEEIEQEREPHHSHESQNTSRQETTDISLSDDGPKTLDVGSAVSSTHFRDLVSASRNPAPRAR